MYQRFEGSARPRSARAPRSASAGLLEGYQTDLPLPLSPEEEQFFYYLEIGFASIFTVELLFRFVLFAQLNVLKDVRSTFFTEGPVLDGALSKRSFS